MQPDWRMRSRSSAFASAVIATIGICLRSGLSLMRFTTSIPSISGRQMSSTIRSGGRSTAAERAA